MKLKVSTRLLIAYIGIICLALSGSPAGGAFACLGIVLLAIAIFGNSVN